MHERGVMKSKAELLRDEIKKEYEAELDENTGQLYNRFIAYIAEARVPLYHVQVVLDIIQAEVTDQIRKKQGLI